MPYLGFEQVVTDSSVDSITELTVTPNTTHVEILADTQDCRYTMDDNTNPAEASGMIFKVGDEPKQFGIEDLNRIRYTRGAGSDGNLNLHCFAGRDI